MSHEVNTSEALATDPTTPEGVAYWRDRHDWEEELEQMAEMDDPAEWEWIE
jgi:hypothetical protein